MSRKYVMAAATFAWLAAVLSAFWLFYFQQITVFDHSAPYSTDEKAHKRQAVIRFLQQQGFNTQGAEPSYYHLVSDQCHCYDYAKPVINGWLEKTQQNHTILGTSNALAGIQENTSYEEKMYSLSQSSIDNLKHLVPATPALIIVRNNQVQYIGPHSSGANCGEGNSFIDLYLNNLNMGFEQPYANLTQKGCFCRWQNPLASMMPA
jgi:hypothetical protein